MVSLSLSHFHFDIISNFSAFCDSTFMITLQNVIIYEDKFTVEFKSGLTVDVEE